MGAFLSQSLGFSRVGILLYALYAFSNQSQRHKQIALATVGALYYAWRLHLFSRRWAPPPAGAAVFITGADTGIGRTTSLYLNSLGFRVFAGVLNETSGEALAAQAKVPGKFVPIVCDVTQPSQVQAAASAVAAATNGNLWGLVNNAGVALADGPVEFVPMDRVQKTLDVNLFGVWSVTRAFLPLVRQARGRVVNIASINGFFVWEHHAAYCVSKHGVEALTDCLRLELEPLGSFVACIEPGGVATEIWQSARNVVVECWKQMGPKCWEVYGDRDTELLDKFLKDGSKRNSDPQVVADAIRHALCDPFPQTRYRVAAGAGFLGALQLCPQSWKDYLARKLASGSMRRPLPP